MLLSLTPPSAAFVVHLHRRPGLATCLVKASSEAQNGQYLLRGRGCCPRVSRPALQTRRMACRSTKINGGVFKGQTLLLTP